MNDVGLDSLQLINLILLVEEEFAVEVDFDSFQVYHLSSLDRFTGYVAGLAEEHDAACLLRNVRGRGVLARAGPRQAPGAARQDSPRIVEAMDEMLFAFCDPGDTVLTARRMDDAHADYLHAIGFQFNRNRFDFSAASCTRRRSD